MNGRTLSFAFFFLPLYHYYIIGKQQIYAILLLQLFYSRVIITLQPSRWAVAVAGSIIEPTKHRNNAGAIQLNSPCRHHFHISFLRIYVISSTGPGFTNNNLNTCSFYLKCPQKRTPPFLKSIHQNKLATPHIFMMIINQL